eukprot:9103868-Heterocapsa_arctica.AAC.1
MRSSCLRVPLGVQVGLDRGVRHRLVVLIAAFRIPQGDDLRGPFVLNVHRRRKESHSARRAA